MISSLISRIVILVLGTLYPAYASYKAIRTKNVKEYVKWMMYWIVFALFTCAETFADIFISWLPFYYELKIAFVLWLLSPATKGSSILYRKFVHPHFAKREQEIDSYIAQASDQGYYALVTLGSKGLNYAANVVVNTAMKGQARIVEQIKSYSMTDLSSPDAMSSKPQVRSNRPILEEEDELDNRLTEERFQSEMAEMARGEKEKPVSILKRSASTRVQKSKESELYPVDEIEETASDPERSQTHVPKQLICKQSQSSVTDKLRIGRSTAVKQS